MRLRPALRRRLRHGIFALACALACALTAGAVRAGDDAEPPHTVQAPHYGDTLFHFYQDHYFTAITTLMASQRIDRVAPHGDEAEILRGGMLLSYGVQHEAEAIFAQLVARGASPAVRDRAWFYLAKISFQRGNLDTADAAIARVEHHLPPALDEERALLQAQLLMARDDNAGAARTLAALTDNGRDKHAGLRYARYNLGVALIKSGDAAGGGAVLDKLGRAGAEDAEYRSLRDRANLALGYTALADQRPADARAVLERVRLQGAEANKALLGFGWAAVALHDPQRALVPWTELAGREASDTAALEAQIAVPYAYAELGAYSQALDHYNAAIATYQQADATIDATIAAIRSGRLLQALIVRNPGDEMGWFWNLERVPELPNTGHLQQVLAQHDFQEAFKNYRDLLFLAKNLQEWRDKLGAFDDMLATRRKAYAERLPQVRARASEIGLGALQQRRAEIEAEVARGAAAADGVAFADARQRDLLTRLQTVQAAVDGSDAAPEMVAARDRVRLAAGALTWQLAQAEPARLWEAQKALGTIAAQVDEAQARDAALGAAQRDEPARFDALAARIAAFDPMLRAMLPRVAVLAQAQQERVQEIAVAQLQQQKQRLQAYATQARFAVAQLYDRANAPAAAGESAAPANGPVAAQETRHAPQR